MHVRCLVHLILLDLIPYYIKSTKLLIFNLSPFLCYFVYSCSVKMFSLWQYFLSHGGLVGWVGREVRKTRTSLNNFNVIAQSAWRRAADWTAEELGFDSRQWQRFFCLHIVHTGFGAHPDSYPVGT
jgi:hypothetical protein